MQEELKAESSVTSAPGHKRGGVIALVGLVTAFVAGLATFRENVEKIFKRDEPPKIVLKGQVVEALDLTQRHMSHDIHISPHDSEEYLQKIAVTFPASYTGDRDPETGKRYDYKLGNPSIIFDNSVGKDGQIILGIDILSLADYIYKLHPDFNHGYFLCEGSIPVLIESDFFDKTSTHHVEKDFYNIQYRLGRSEVHVIAFDYVGPPTNIDDNALNTMFEKQLNCNTDLPGADTQ